MSIASQLAQEAQQYTKKVEIPEEYKRHWRVFSEEEAHQFPPTRPWDHAIELKEGVPKAINCKVYPTTLTEDEALKNHPRTIGEGVYFKIEVTICITLFLH